MPSIKGTASVSDDHAMTKLLKSTKFPASFGTKVHLSKINKPVLSQWIEQQISKILGFEDEIVSSTAINLFLDGTTVDPRRAQLDLAGFLGEDQAAGFAESLWDMLVDAQAGSTGIPTKLLEEKKLELAKHQQQQQQQQMQRERHARGPPPHGRHPPQQHHDNYNNSNNNHHHNNHNNHDIYSRGGEPRRRLPPDVRPFDRRPPVPHYNDRPPPPRGYPPGRRDERERRDRIAVPVSPPSEDRKPAARDEFGREMKEDGPSFRPLPPPPAHMDRDDHIRDQRPKDRERRRRREESSSSSEESSEESDESRRVNRPRRTTRRSPDDSSDDDRHRRHRSDDRRRYRSRSRERRSTNHRREADRPRSSRSRRERSYSPSDDDGDSDE